MFPSSDPMEAEALRITLTISPKSPSSWFGVAGTSQMALKKKKYLVESRSPIVQPLEAVVAGINARELSNVLGKPFEEGVTVLEGAALELPTRGGGTAKGERERKRETECGADVR